MNKWSLKYLAAAAVGVLTLAGQANAAVSYSYVTDAPDYQVAPGQQVTIKLYLLETLTGGSTSVIDADGGMLGVSTKATKAGGGPASPSTLGTITLNSADFAGPTSVEEGAAGFRFSEGIAAAGGTPGVKTNNTGGNAANQKANAVYLGTVSATGGADVGSTVFNLQPYDNLGGNTLTLNSFYDLDSSSNSPAFTGTSANPTSFSVTVVPEPTFAGVAIVLGAAGSLIRRRRQQA